MEFCTKIFSSIAVEIAKSLVSPITRRVGYLIYYNHNINNLKAEAQKLDDKKTRVKLQVDEAERNLKVIALDVIRWQEKVDDIKPKVGEFLENEIKMNNKCLNGLFPNPISLYSLGRKATKMTLEVVTLLQEAGDFSEIAYYGPPPTVGSSINTEGIKDFESRVSIMNEVWEALKDDELSMINICCMGGVGKTTMMEKLVKRVEKEKLFDEVAMAVVSQNPDFKKIQGEIAASLGFKFDDEEILNVRAGQLHHRVMNGGKKIFVILDDVWDKLDFGKIGLPSRSGGKGLKIVLTSRNEDVCKIMGSQRNFQIKILSDDEAWALFREMAGGVVEHFDINPIARQVAKECRGLPIAIATVARTLENERKDIWEGVLQELRKSTPENILGMQDEVFSRIELSYNWLRSEAAQSCFLLCCLFPEDFNIPVEYLVRYGIGLRLFKGVDNLHQARNKVSILINKLKRSFLLLEGIVERNGYETVKMHDLVRDVAVNITSKEKHSYLVNCDAKMKEWPKIVRHDHCNAISLLCENIKEHPSDMQFPKLKLLQLLGLCQNLPNNFFQGMKELKVLSLNIPSLPKSFGILKNLRTLYLENFICGDISILGALINLEILKIRTYSLKMLPKEIGLLVNLKLLDLSEMPNLRYIPSDVLSKLSKLEEFYVTQSFRNWESMENGEKTNASLKEIETHHVTALEIWVPTTLFLPKVSFLRNLIRFKISIGGYFEKEFSKDSTNKLFLNGNASSEINVLLRKIEALELSEVQLLRTVLCELEYDGFPLLKTMSIYGCEALEFLVDAMEWIPQVGFPKLEKLSLDTLRSLQALWHGEFPNSSFEEQTSGQISNHIQLPWFSNLKDIQIRYCAKLKNVFPLSMARGLTQIQSIQIEECKEIEEIFCGKKVDDEIEFPKLIKLNLAYLPKLIGFCIEMDDQAMNPSLTNSQDVSFDSMEQQSASQMNKTTNIEYDQLRHELSSTSRIRIRLQNLQELKLNNCGSLIVAFPFPIVGQLVQLRTLYITDCKMMEYIFAQGQEENNMVFPNLISITLQSLPNLMAFCPDSHISFDWPSLRHLVLERCPKMRFHETSCHIPSPSTLNQDFPHNSLNGKEIMCPTPCSTFRGLKIRKGRQQKSADLNSILQQSEQKVSMMKNMDSNNIDGQTDQMYFAFPSKLIDRMSNLKEFKIADSNTLEVIFSFEECHDPIQALNSLEDFHLWNLPNLQHICFNIPPKIRVFQNLRVLHVESCGNLIYLFSPSVAKLLVNLQEVTISSCEKMEEIIAKEDEEANMADKIVFPQLRILMFHRLPKLKSFYSGNYALEFPSLETMDFSYCLKMSAFSYGPLSTPKLVTATINSEVFGIEDLNATVKEKILRKVLIYRDRTSRIGYDQLPEGELSKLLILQVEGCENLVNIIPCNLIASFQNLEKLFIEDCESVKEIFEYEGMNIEKEENVAAFSHLEEIQLLYLPELDHIFNKIPKSVIAFQKLRNLAIYYCNSLRNLFSVHVAKGLVQLQELNVSESKMLEEIVAKEDEEEQEASLDRIVFPQLTSIEFSSLPKLQSFYSGIYALELPLLETLSFEECDGMKTFSCGSLTTPKLKKLKINDKDHQVMEDFNATVIHLFNSKEEKLNDTKDKINITEEGAIEEEQIKIPLDDKEATDEQIEIPLDDERATDEQIEIPLNEEGATEE